MFKIRSRRTVLIGCSIVVLAILCFSSIWGFVEINSYLYRSSPGGVADLFVRALMTNDAEIAHSLVSVDKYGEIEQWISIHQSYHCDNFVWDTGAASVGRSIDEDNWNYGVNFQCDDPVTPHCFSVSNIHLTKVDDKWQITHWVVDCEINDYCGMCIGK